MQSLSLRTLPNYAVSITLHNCCVQRVVVQHRPCTTDKDCASWRYWNSSVADSFVHALSGEFRSFQVCAIDGSHLLEY
jgi:hypothetical protein